MSAAAAVEAVEVGVRCSDRAHGVKRSLSGAIEPVGAVEGGGYILTINADCQSQSRSRARESRAAVGRGKGASRHTVTL